MLAGCGATKSIAIVGGGVSGALTAYHLVRQHVDAQVIVIDPRPEMGLGLAYSTPSLRHLLNVPAGKISALPLEPDHFLEWLRQNFDREATPATFAPRAVFGRYIRSLLARTRGITFLQTSVVDLVMDGDSVVLTLSDGEQRCTDFAVLATGNFDPAMLPGIEGQAVQGGSYCHNAWLRETYDGLASDAPVVLIGTGLTAVDVLLRLREIGHHGTITAVSRHGVMPQPHAPYPAAETVAIPDGTPATCASYLRALRRSIQNGTEWRASIDSLRAATNDLWLALPADEQRRFNRHLKRRWDVVRHRMAPSIAELIDAELAAGTLILRAGSLAGVKTEPGGARVSVRKDGAVENLQAARVINCTGPNMNYRRVDSPLLASLFAQGLAAPGPLGGGFQTTRCGAIVSASGQVAERIFNLGPGRLGTLLESIAIPEIRQQAIELAGILVEHVKRANDPLQTRKIHDLNAGIARA